MDHPKQGNKEVNGRDSCNVKLIFGNLFLIQVEVSSNVVNFSSTHKALYFCLLNLKQAIRQ